VLADFREYTVKKVSEFPVPSRMSQTFFYNAPWRKSIVTIDSEALDLSFLHYIFRCAEAEIFVHVSDKRGICVGDLIYD
jgi:hypothetical protein